MAAPGVAGPLWPIRLEYRQSKQVYTQCAPRSFVFKVTPSGFLTFLTICSYLKGVRGWRRVRS